MTIRTAAELAALYPDNTGGLVSPEDLRDLVDSTVPVIATTDQLQNATAVAAAITELGRTIPGAGLYRFRITIFGHGSNDQSNQLVLGFVADPAITEIYLRGESASGGHVDDGEGGATPEATDVYTGDAERTYTGRLHTNAGMTFVPTYRMPDGASGIVRVYGGSMHELWKVRDIT